MQPRSSDSDFIRSRYTRPIAFLVGALLFFLPFVEIRCNGVALAQNTGIGLATGADFKEAGLTKQGKDNFERTSARPSKVSKDSGKVFVSVLIALILGVAGAVLSFVAPRNARVAMFVGILAAVALLALMVEMKSTLSELDSRTGSTARDNPFKMDMIIKPGYTVGYWLSLLSFIAAAFVAYRQTKWVKPEAPFSFDTAGERTHDTPPAGAPQTPLNNPGDQSNFPPAPRESEIG